MGLIYAKNIKGARRKVAKGLTAKERKDYIVKKAKLKSDIKNYKLYKVTKRR